jgi:outer membrane cobalamin receptor
MPVFEYGGWIMYNLADKFIGQINLHGFDKQYVKLPDYMNQSEGMKLKGFTDLNLRFEYRYTDRISAFVSFNNILSQSYQRWQDYNTQRFNLMGGFTFGF